MKIVNVDGVEVPGDVHDAMLKVKNYVAVVRKRAPNFDGFSIGRGGIRAHGKVDVEVLPEDGGSAGDKNVPSPEDQKRVVDLTAEIAELEGELVKADKSTAKDKGTKIGSLKTAIATAKKIRAEITEGVAE